MNIQELATFQAVMEQIARERRAAQRTIATLERVADWRLQIALYSELHRRYWQARNEGDQWAEVTILLVLISCRPRYQA